MAWSWGGFTDPNRLMHLPSYLADNLPTYMKAISDVASKYSYDTIKNTNPSTLFQKYYSGNHPGESDKNYDVTMSNHTIGVANNLWGYLTDGGKIRPSADEAVLSIENFTPNLIGVSPSAIRKYMHARYVSELSQQDRDRVYVSYGKYARTGEIKPSTLTEYGASIYDAVMKMVAMTEDVFLALKKAIESVVNNWGKIALGVVALWLTSKFVHGYAVGLGSRPAKASV